MICPYLRRTHSGNVTICVCPARVIGFLNPTETQTFSPQSYKANYRTENPFLSVINRHLTNRI